MRWLATPRGPGIEMLVWVVGMWVSLEVHVGEGVVYPPSSSGCVRLLAMKLRAGGASNFGFLPAL